MEQVLDNIAWSVEENGGSLTCEVLPAVEGYSAHFVQVFQNLLGNAIKYRGERPLIIRIFAEKLGEEWRFAVADNGMGIDPKYHQQVFGVFKRLHRDAIPGTGIGLAICQRVVERYGGRIWVESEIDQGSTFYFTLPFRQDHLLQPIAVNPLVES
jgi:signal transduction histidine kinase